MMSRPLPAFKDLFKFEQIWGKMTKQHDRNSRDPQLFFRLFSSSPLRQISLIAVVHRFYILFFVMNLIRIKYEREADPNSSRPC